MDTQAAIVRQGAERGEGDQGMVFARPINRRSRSFLILEKIFIEFAFCWIGFMIFELFAQYNSDGFAGVHVYGSLRVVIVTYILSGYIVLLIISIYKINKDRIDSILNYMLRLSLVWYAYVLVAYFVFGAREVGLFMMVGIYVGGVVFFVTELKSLRASE